MNKKGFTYIDTVISLCVAAIIISMFILAYRELSNYSERAEVKNVVQIIKKARLSAIMQMIDVEVVLDGDEIVVSNINDMKKVYKLEHLKFE
ncbi:MAG: type II secretion system protein, partial [Fenollaria timonensis]